MCYAEKPARLTGLKERRAWDSNPQPLSGHDISSVAASHSLTLQNAFFLAAPTDAPTVFRLGPCGRGGKTRDPDPGLYPHRGLAETAWRGWPLGGGGGRAVGAAGRRRCRLTPAAPRAPPCRRAGGCVGRRNDSMPFHSASRPANFFTCGGETPRHARGLLAASPAEYPSASSRGPLTEQEPSNNLLVSGHADRPRYRHAKDFGGLDAADGVVEVDLHFQFCQLPLHGWPFIGVGSTPTSGSRGKPSFVVPPVFLAASQRVYGDFAGRLCLIRLAAD
jgi:hypothetical protein